MRRLVEICAFSGLAVGAHLALWGAMSGDGMESAGSGGDAVVSLAAASGEVSDLVAAWTAKPDVLDDLGALPPDPSPEAPSEIDVTVEVAMTPPDRATVQDRPQMAEADTAPDAPALPAAALTRPLESISQPRLPQPDISPSSVLPDDKRRMSKAAQPKLAEPSRTALPEIDRTPPPDNPTAPRVSKRPKERPDQLVASNSTVMSNQAPDQKQTQQNSAATQKQVAAGAASGQNAGQKKATTAATLSASQRQSLMATWGASIRNGVDRRKRSPSGTTATGTAVLHLTVSPEGRLLGAALAKSSGDARLDRAALQAAQSARMPKAPKGLTDPNYKFNLPVAFTR